MYMYIHVLFLLYAFMDPIVPKETGRLIKNSNLSLPTRGDGVDEVLTSTHRTRLRSRQLHTLWQEDSACQILSTIMIEHVQ